MDENYKPTLRNGWIGFSIYPGLGIKPGFQWHWKSFIYIKFLWFAFDMCWD